MNQKGSHFRKVITVLAVTYLLHVNAATDNQNVINEIDKLEHVLNTLKTPPELIDAVLKQVEHHCQSSKNRTIDESYLTNASRCVEQYFNVSKVAADMRAAVPEGKMDDVFRDMCVKWPQVKNCMGDFFDIVEDCWQKGNKVSKFVDEFVRFYCGDENNGERIAIFFAEGGFECIQTHGDEVKKCIEKKQDIAGIELNEESLSNIDLNDLANKPLPLPKTDEICTNMEQLYECVSVEFRKCKDPTPENLMSSMLKQVSKALECKISESTHHRSTSAGISSGISPGMAAMDAVVLLGIIGAFAI